MDVIESQSTVFQSGGSLAETVLSYVTRSADEELYKQLKLNNFCYILSARQMGKSSLRVRTMSRLQKEGYRCVSFDMTSIGGKYSTIDQWYFSLIFKISQGLGLAIDIKKWWLSKSEHTAVSRMTLFFESIVLQEIKDNIIICMDEIDALLSMEKTEINRGDFFAAIRSLFNARVDNQELNRLNFVLIGVATPGELINDPQRTPFNVGIPIYLSNFTIENTTPLILGFANIQTDKDALMQEILYWTGGQPFLTQKLANAISENETEIFAIKSVVQKHVDYLFFSNLYSTDEANLVYVKDRIIGNKMFGSEMLSIYSQVCSDEKIKINKSSQAHLYLLLSGIVIDRNGYFVLGNRIYERKFNLEWIKDAFSLLDRPFANNLSKWLLADKSEAAALQNEDLVNAEEWAIKRNDLSEIEKEFLYFSRQTNVNQVNNQLKADFEKYKLQTQATELKNIKGLKRKHLKRNFSIILMTGIVILFLGLYAWYLDTKVDEATQEMKNKAIASELISEAKQLANTDPTQALQLLALVKKMPQAISAEKEFLEILHNQYFYKTLKVAKYQYTNIDISPDGKLLLALDFMQNAFIFDLINEKQTILLKVVTNSEIANCSFSADNKHFLICTKNGTIQLFENSGKQINQHKSLSGKMIKAEFMAGSEKIIAAFSDGTIKQWNFADNAQDSFKLKSPISDFALSIDGKKIGVVKQSKTLSIINITDKSETEFTANAEDILSISFSPDGQKIACNLANNNCEIFDIAGKRISTLEGHNQRIKKAIFAPNSFNILTISDDKTIRIWNENGKEIGQLKGYRGSGLSACFSPSGKSIYTSATDKTLRKWLINELEKCIYLPAEIDLKTAAFSLSGKYLSIIGNDSSLKILNTEDDQQIFSCKSNSSILCVAFNITDKYVAFATDKNAISVVDLNTFELISFAANAATINSIAISSKDLILSGSSDNSAILWTISGKKVKEFKLNSACLMVNFAPSGSKLATGLKNGTVVFWDENFQKSHSISFSNEEVKQGHFSANEQLFGYLSGKNNVFTYNFVDSTSTNYACDSVTILDLKFNLKSNSLIASSFDGQIKQWNLAGKLVNQYKDFSYPVHTLFCGNDNKILGFSDKFQIGKWRLIKENDLRFNTNNYDQLTKKVKANIRKKLNIKVEDISISNKNLSSDIDSMFSFFKF